MNTERQPLKPLAIIDKGNNAVFSRDRTYRYILTRQWDEGKPYAMFIGLNPSTADETRDDPTIRRCINFAKRWGYGALVMMNLFAYRATDPEVMKEAEDPIGPETDSWIHAFAQDAGIVIAAWGVHGTHLNRSAAIKLMLPELYCLGMTQKGHPKHPLYLHREIVPVRYC